MAWDRLFMPGARWLGTDGAYSVALGDDAGTLFLFGDTLFRKKPSGPVHVRRNTSAWLGVDRPSGAFWHVPWPRGTADLLGPSDEKTWLWPMDGLVSAQTLHVFSLHVRPTPGPTGFAFEPTGVSVRSFPELWSEPRGGSRRSSFLFSVKSEAPSVFGSALLEDMEGDTVHEGAVTVYGYREDTNVGKELLAARVPPGGILRPRRWRFWNGSDWGASRRAAEPVANRLSAEFSVTRVEEDRFVVVFQLDGIGPVTAARVGESPTGPFGPPKPLWRCPEARQGPDVYCYNAKAHPHLSRPGELLVSYNVNRTDTDDPAALVGLYRPRFLRVPLEMLQR